MPAIVHCPNTETLNSEIPNRLIFIPGDAITKRFHVDPAENDENGDRREVVVEKAEGFVVFSGAAMSILKALN